jgi:hypothetical protein
LLGLIGANAKSISETSLVQQQLILHILQIERKTTTKNVNNGV